MMKKIFHLLIIFRVCLVTLPVLASQNQITFWTIEMETERLKVQREIAQAFTNKTGIDVQVVPVEENHLADEVNIADAAKRLPDVLFHPIDFTFGWIDAGILDARSATEVVNDLGKETFGSGALKIAGFSGGYAAVPADGWGQLLFFRKDLFQEKGLGVPDNWESILGAAQVLHNPPLVWGFEIATDPSTIYTQQVFEHLALSNGVRLIGATGNIELNTPEMIRTLKFYKALAGFAPRGNLNWQHTRRDYMSGHAAMIIWSPFILDELSGLRQELPVVPDIMKGEPGYLAKNTGIVAILKGPQGAAQYGQINCLGITRDANKALAKQWVEYLLSDGYLTWLGMAPEGKLPIRKGTRHLPRRFIDGWLELTFGVTKQAKMSEYYGRDMVKTIIDGVDGFDRWGFPKEKGTLVSKIYATKIIPEILKQCLDGKLSAEQAARMMDERVKALSP